MVGRGLLAWLAWGWRLLRGAEIRHFSERTLADALTTIEDPGLRMEESSLDASIDANHTLAEASKLVPKGVICLASALAFHELTDQLPPKVWMAIGPKDWRPRFQYPPVRFARFPETQLNRDVEYHRMDGIRVPIFGIAKMITDLFRDRRTVGINLALEGLREALRKRKTTPAEIAKRAVEAGVWKTMIAEKFQAMVAFGRANSRMKDFYDVWVLAKSYDFNGDRLVRAIAATFDRRGTPLPDALPDASALMLKAAALPPMTTGELKVLREGREMPVRVEIGERLPLRRPK